MSEYIAHHGILGQKWGIRRYQNKDGSLTPAGQKRYNKLQGELDQLGGKAKQPVKKKLSDMSDEELLLANNRLRMETDYQRMYSQLHPVKESMWKKMGTKITQEALPNAVSQSVQDIVGNTLKKWGNYASDKIYEEKTGMKPLNDLKKKVELLQKKKERQNLEDELSEEARELNKLKREKDIQNLKDEISLLKDPSLNRINLTKLQSEQKTLDLERQIAELNKKKENNWEEKKDPVKEAVEAATNYSKYWSSINNGQKAYSDVQNRYMSYVDELYEKEAQRQADKDLFDRVFNTNYSTTVAALPDPDKDGNWISLDDDRFKHMDNTEYLVHHGIKGQKWGVRRFQNENGTLTDAGRRRYRDDDEKSGPPSSENNPARYGKNDTASTYWKTVRDSYVPDWKSMEERAYGGTPATRPWNVVGSHYIGGNKIEGSGGMLYRNKITGEQILKPHGAQANSSYERDNPARNSENNPARYGNFEQQRKDAENDKGTWIRKRTNGIAYTAALPYYDDNGKLISRQPIFNGRSSVSRGGEEFVNNRTGETRLRTYGEDYDPWTGKETSGSSSKNDPARYGTNDTASNDRQEKSDSSKSNKPEQSNEVKRSEQKQINDQTKGALAITRQMNSLPGPHADDIQATKAIVSAVSSKVVSTISSAAANTIQAGANLINKILGTRATKSNKSKSK